MNRRNHHPSSYHHHRRANNNPFSARRSSSSNSNHNNNNNNVNQTNKNVAYLMIIACFGLTLAFQYSSFWDDSLTGQMSTLGSMTTTDANTSSEAKANPEIQHEEQQHQPKDTLDSSPLRREPPPPPPPPPAAAAAVEQDTDDTDSQKELPQLLDQLQQENDGKSLEFNPAKSEETNNQHAFSSTTTTTTTRNSNSMYDKPDYDCVYQQREALLAQQTTVGRKLKIPWLSSVVATGWSDNDSEEPMDHIHDHDDLEDSEEEDKSDPSSSSLPYSKLTLLFRYGSSNLPKGFPFWYNDAVWNCVVIQEADQSNTTNNTNSKQATRITATTPAHVRAKDPVGILIMLDCPVVTTHVQVHVPLPKTKADRQKLANHTRLYSTVPHLDGHNQTHRWVHTAIPKRAKGEDGSNTQPQPLHCPWRIPAHERAISCTMIRETWEQVPEWVAYHYILGVQRFYLYVDEEFYDPTQRKRSDENDIDNFDNIDPNTTHPPPSHWTTFQQRSPDLAKLVTLVPFQNSGFSMQTVMQNDCLLRANQTEPSRLTASGDSEEASTNTNHNDETTTDNGLEERWVLVNDVDEYFQIMQQNLTTTSSDESDAATDTKPNIHGLLPRFLKQFENYPEPMGGLRANEIYYLNDPQTPCCLHNATYVDDSNSTLTIIEQYPWRDKTHKPVGSEKVIVRPRHVEYYCRHAVTLGEPTRAMNPQTELRLAHYKLPLLRKLLILINHVNHQNERLLAANPSLNISIPPPATTRHTWSDRLRPLAPKWVTSSQMQVKLWRVEGQIDDLNQWHLQALPDETMFRFVPEIRKLLNLPKETEAI